MNFKIISGTFFLFILMSIGCSKESPQENKATESEKPENENLVVLTDGQMKNTAIQTGNFENKTINSLLKVTGTIVVPPQNTISITLPYGGYLQQTPLLEGMHIRKGQPIAVIKNPEFITFQEEYLTAKSELQYKNQDLKRQKELNKSKASSDKTVQAVQAEVNSLQIAIKSLEEKMQLAGINPKTVSLNSITQNSSVYAPINGYVSKINANTGSYVSSSDVLFELIDLDKTLLQLKVFEKDLAQISVGQTVLAYTNNDKETYTARIILIGKDLSKDRSVNVLCQFLTPHSELLPGTYMNAEVTSQQNLSDLLPEEAVVNYQGKEYIFIEKGKNTYEMKQIQAGIKNHPYVEVLNSREFGNTPVVKKDAYTLLMALKNKEE